MSEHDGKKIKVVRGTGDSVKEGGALPGHEAAAGPVGSQPVEAPKLEKIREEVAATRDTTKGAGEVLDLIDRALKKPPEQQSLPAALAERWVEAQKESCENRDCWLRAAAELENFRKRTVQEKSRLLKYGNEQLLRDLLPVVDNLERALAHAERTEVSETFVDGVSLIAGMLKDVLERYGVREIKALGEAFDPNVHEAISRMAQAGTGPNVVVQEIETGYLYHDRLLRPAKVVVSA